MFGRVPLRTGGAVRHLTAHRVPTGRLMVYRLRAHCRAQGQSREGFVQKGIFGGPPHTGGRRAPRTRIQASAIGGRSRPSSEGGE